MNFSAYNILSALVPGFTILFLLFHFKYLDFSETLVIPYTAVAFVVGYFVNTLSSWVEDILHFTWNGKPSDALLNGKSIWKVRFYNSETARNELIKESKKETPSNDELFQIAQRYSSTNDKVNDLLSNYAFSRVILLTIVICLVIILTNDHTNYKLIIPCVALFLIAWLRCKQMGYYYVREVLSQYLNKHQSKNNPKEG